jgi:hypothetical protein
MTITTIGLDLANSVFQAHGVDESSATVLVKKLHRKQMLPFFSTLPPCLIAVEACGTAHYWARTRAAMRTLEPDVARAQRVAQVEHHRDLAEASVITSLHPRLTPPLGMWAHKVIGGPASRAAKLPGRTASGTATPSPRRPRWAPTASRSRSSRSPTSIWALYWSSPERALARLGAAA